MRTHPTSRWPDPVVSFLSNSHFLHTVIFSLFTVLYISDTLVCCSPACVFINQSKMCSKGGLLVRVSADGLGLCSNLSPCLASGVFEPLACPVCSVWVWEVRLSSVVARPSRPALDRPRKCWIRARKSSMNHGNFGMRLEYTYWHSG